MKKSAAFCLLWTIFSLTIFGQREETVFGKSGFRISGAWAGPSIGVGQIDDELLVFRGSFGGIEFGKRLFIGWGGFETDNDVGIDVLDNDHFKMDYSGFFLGYIPNSHKRVHSSFSVLVGSGNAQIGNSENDNIFVMQPTFGLELNIFRWFHLCLDGGYRLVTNVNIPDMTNQDLSGPYAEVKMKFGFSW